MSAPETVEAKLWHKVYSPQGTLLGTLGDKETTHAASFRVAGNQPATKDIGAIKIPLRSPGDESFDKVRDFLLSLDEKQRIESYDNPDCAGSPRFSSIIDASAGGIDMNLNSGGWNLNAKDTIVIADGFQTLVGETVNGSTWATLKAYLGGDVQSYLDDFSGGFPSASYNKVGTWTPSGLVPLTDELGAYAQTAVTTTDTYAYTTASFGNNYYAPLHQVDAIFTVYPGTDTSNAGNVGVLLDFVGGNGDSWISGHLVFKADGAGTYSVDAVIYQRASGVMIAKATASNILTKQSGPWTGQITLIGFYTTAGFGNLVFYLYVNGQLATSWAYGNPAGLAGPVGMYWSAVAGGSPSVRFRQLSFTSRATVGGLTPLAFQPGSTLTGSDSSTRKINQPWQGQTFLDVWNLCASVEGWNWRKTPGVGWGQDVLDFGSALGTDHATDNSVVFEQGRNIKEMRRVSQALSFASALRFQANPSSAGGGTITYRIPSAVTAYGLWQDTHQVLQVTDMYAALAYVRQLAALRQATVQAWEVEVYRDPTTADKFRELDYVLVHAPDFGVKYQKMQVVAYDYTEGQQTQTLTLNQRPWDAKGISTGHVTQLVEMLANVYKNR